jgi:hypothetical protein
MFGLPSDSWSWARVWACARAIGPENNLKPLMHWYGERLTATLTASRIVFAATPSRRSRSMIETLTAWFQPSVGRWGHRPCSFTMASICVVSSSGSIGGRAKLKLISFPRARASPPPPIFSSSSKIDEERARV